MNQTASRSRARAEEDVGRPHLVEEATGGPVAKFNTVRLPYHDAFSERFGVDRGAWKVLVEAIWPTATSVDSVAMALAYCKARNLDPFKKVVHIVPMWSKSLSRLVETVWPGIAEIRTTAFRTGQYAGCDEAAFGEEVESTLSGTKVRHPAWCRITVHRELAGRICKFVGPKVEWLETYATKKHDTDAPNEMWATRPEGQIEKCAEAAALRRAFPEELGNVYSAEEMEGRLAHGDVQGVPVERAAGPTPPSPPPAPPPVPALTPPAAEPGEIQEEASPTLPPAESAKLKSIMLAKLAAFTTSHEIDEWSTGIEDGLAALLPTDREEVRREWDARLAEFFERERTADAD